MATKTITENRTCQNCQTTFPIYDSDVVFYDKIGVPKPTFCPECRMIRRMVWRNVRSLFRRTCGLCEKVIISMYKEDGAPVYCTDCWNSTKWDPLSYGREYDFSKSFFTQLSDLFKITPRFYQYRTGTLVNSDFSNYSADNKNVYLSFSVIGCEDVAYSETIDNSKNSLDCYGMKKADGCYWNVDGENNYNCIFTVQSQNCIDTTFVYDCVNCSNCFLSYNLRNQSYVFMNQKLSKEAYLEKVKEYDISTYSGFLKTKKLFDSMMENDAIHRYAQIYSSQDVIGDFITNTRNIFQAFDVYNSENVAYGTRVLNVKDSLDLQGVGGGELIYDSVAASWGTSRDFFCYITLGCRDCEYSLILRNCANCFGCVGLTNAQYCILNKQYSKEEYFELIDKIKKHMVDMPYIDAKGRVFAYGEFMPYEMSPFGYNEGNSTDFFPISEAFAKEKGYNWFTREKRDYAISMTIDELPDAIEDVPDDIVNQTIGCPNDGNAEFQCTTAYRITADELQFYRQKKLPLPRKCPNCRHYERLLGYRNPMRLYTRNCMFPDCGNTFETTYAPDRTEKVYCENCYKREVL